MKFNKTISLAAACMLPLCASAQFTPSSSDQGVSIYGRLDASLNAVKYQGESGTRKALSSDTSLIGFRGVEDLGDGLRAYFKMEHGFALDTGAQSNATTFWNRETFVGLRSNTFGGIELGTHWDPFIYLNIKTDPFSRAQTGALLTLMQGTAVRGYVPLLNNTVLWGSPDWGGLVIRLQMAAPEGTGINKNYAGAVDYTNGRFYMGFAFDDIQALRTTVGLTGAGTVRAKTYGLGTTYRFDAVKLSAYAQQNRTDDLENVTGYQLGATVPIGLGEIRTAWERSNQVGSSASLVSVGYLYNLSKRTFLYTTAAKLTNGSTTKFAMYPTSQDFAAMPPKLGQDLTGFQVGMRHIF
jgi:predicted porin